MYSRRSLLEMAQSKPKGFLESLALNELEKDEFETVHPPQRMGNPLNIAYGGYALAAACKAACLSVPKGYHLYSMLGNYLSPAFTDRPLRASILAIRHTRTFATRQVEVSQKQSDGKLRVCLLAVADFQVKEKGTLLEYSRSPSKKYSHYKAVPTQQEAYQKLLDQGKISKQLLDTHSKAFSVVHNIYDIRPCPEGIFAHNLYGMAKSLPTMQDSLLFTSRTTADWFRCQEPLSAAVGHVANLTFFSDTEISFAPLSFSHLWFDDCGECSSLDFALRFFRNADAVDVNQWHLRELKTSVGSEGRTYSESWIWDEEGRAVACMSQQSILRVKDEKKKPEKGKL